MVNHQDIFDSIIELYKNYINRASDKLKIFYQSPQKALSKSTKLDNETHTKHWASKPSHQHLFYNAAVPEMCPYYKNKFVMCLGLKFHLAVFREQLQRKCWGLTQSEGNDR